MIIVYNLVMSDIGKDSPEIGKGAPFKPFNLGGGEHQELIRRYYDASGRLVEAAQFSDSVTRAAIEGDAIDELTDVSNKLLTEAQLQKTKIKTGKS
jgi:hypothetical protein